METLAELLALPGRLPETLNDFLVSYGNRDEDESILQSDPGPSEWAEAMRLIENRPRH